MKQQEWIVPWSLSNFSAWRIRSIFRWTISLTSHAVLLFRYIFPANFFLENMILSVLRMQWMCKSCKQQQLTVRGLQLDSVSSLIRGNASTDLKLMTRSHSQPRQDLTKRIFSQDRKEKRRREREMSQRDENNKFETEQKGRLVLKWIGYEQRSQRTRPGFSLLKKERETHLTFTADWSKGAPNLYQNCPEC